MKHNKIKKHVKNNFKKPLEGAELWVTIEKNGRTLSNVHHKILIIHQKNSQVRDNWQTTTKEGHHNSKRVFCTLQCPHTFRLFDE